MRSTMRWCSGIFGVMFGIVGCSANESGSPEDAGSVSSAPTSAVSTTMPPTTTTTTTSSTTTTTTITTTTSTTTTTLPEVLGDAARITPREGIMPITDAISFSWDWSPPCAVPITQLVDDGRFELTREAIVTLEARDDGFYDLDVETLSISGRGLPASTAQSIVEQDNLARPTLIIDEQGYTYDIGDTDELVQVLIDELGLTDPDEIAFFESPSFLDLMFNELYETTWGPWVEEWLFIEFINDEPYQVQALEGADAQLEFRGIGVYPDGQVHVRSSAVYEGDDLYIFFDIGTGLISDAFLDDEEAGDFQSAMADIALSGYVAYATEVIIDPVTLRPSTVLVYSDENVDVEGDDDFVEFSRELTTFDWANAVGCGVS